jgi:hypothetical protein
LLAMRDCDSLVASLNREAGHARTETSPKPDGAFFGS